MATASSVAIDGALQLRLGHLRTTLDALVPSLLVQLCLRAPAGTAVRPEAATATRRDVGDRGAAGLPRLARAGPFLVHGPGGDLLGRVLVAALLLQALLDVLVLAFAFGAPGFLGHDLLLPVPSRPCRRRSGRGAYPVRPNFTRSASKGRRAGTHSCRSSQSRRRRPWSPSMRIRPGRETWRAGPGRSRTWGADRSAPWTSPGLPGRATRAG